MIRNVCLTLGVSLVTATLALAQAPAAPAPTTVPLAIQRGYANVKMVLTQAADKLSDADTIAFKPSSMAEVRNYGQLFAHVANAQYGTCSAVKGVPNPNQGKNLETDLKTKAEFVKALADSFAFCDDAYASLTDANANDMIAQGRGMIARAAALMNNVVHDNEMYGTAGVYLRAKGIVPPSTENAAAARGGAGGGGGGRGGPGGRGTP